MTDHSGHNPVCDYRYPTKTCGRGNLAVRSSWDNVTSPRWGGRASREGARRLLAPRRSGARVDGMANPGELPINVVRSNKPKALRGGGGGDVIPLPDTWVVAHPGLPGPRSRGPREAAV